LPKRNAVIFVHGCFWHGHTCHLYRLPKTRPDFWQKKIDRNRAVDARALKALRERKLRVGILWECALKGRARLPPEEVLQRTIVWLRTGKRTLEIKGSSLRSTSKRGSAISK
jgi:DNA mismatch endonuclease (patch repair protein)